jgi:hypothetical protein
VSDFALTFAAVRTSLTVVAESESEEFGYRVLKTFEVLDSPDGEPRPCSSPDEFGAAAELLRAHKRRHAQLRDAL